MSRRAVCFVDRDGTLIVEPEDEQVDRLDKLALVPGVIPALLRLRDLGYRFVVVTNQDGLGTASFPTEDYERVHRPFVELFASQGIAFDDVLVCPHRPEDGCTCRKPHLGLLAPTLAAGELDLERSCVVGDRGTDVGLAENLGVRGFLLARNGVPAGADDPGLTWDQVARAIEAVPRIGRAERTTRETTIRATVDLDGPGTARVATGIGFLDHMLEQLAKHGAFDLDLRASGDLEVDEHHTVEDVAIVLGTALERALGTRAGIGRYGASEVALPMDEAAARVLVDLSGRSYLRFEGEFPRERVGELPTELVEHFFRSLADSLGATLHVSVTGENAHHMVEVTFKAVARALRPALAHGAVGPGGSGGEVPSTKGSL